MAKTRRDGRTSYIGAWDVDDKALMERVRLFKEHHPQALIKVVAGIRADGGHLLVRSTKGVWKYVQGKLRIRKLKKGGYAIEASGKGLEREVFEELGLRIRSPGVQVRFLGTWERDDDEVPILYVAFHIELPAILLSGMCVEIEELKGFMWMRPDEIPEYLHHGTDHSERRREITLAVRDAIEQEKSAT